MAFSRLIWLYRVILDVYPASRSAQRVCRQMRISHFSTARRPKFFQPCYLVAFTCTLGVFSAPAPGAPQDDITLQRLLTRAAYRSRIFIALRVSGNLLTVRLEAS